VQSPRHSPFQGMFAVGSRLPFVPLQGGTPWGINLKGVIIGGLVAGLVLNVVDYIFWGVLFAKDFQAALEAIGRPLPPRGVVGLVLIPVAAVAGARFYAEPA
jgi:uncharacterized membrane protein